MYVSLMANEAAHSFHVLFPDVCISSVEKCLFKPFAHFSNISMIFPINGIRPHLLFRPAALPGAVCLGDLRLVPTEMTVVQ